MKDLIFRGGCVDFVDTVFNRSNVDPALFAEAWVSELDASFDDLGYLLEGVVVMTNDAGESEIRLKLSLRVDGEHLGGFIFHEITTMAYEIKLESRGHTGHIGDVLFHYSPNNLLPCRKYGIALRGQSLDFGAIVESIAQSWTVREGGRVVAVD